jgi:hypothetical protein
MKPPVVMVDMRVVGVMSVGMTGMSGVSAQTFERLTNQITGASKKENGPDHEKPNRGGRTFQLTREAPEKREAHPDNNEHNPQAPRKTSLLDSMPTHPNHSLI